MRALWRLGAWGCVATFALAATLVVSQSEVGAQRLQDALATINVPEQPKPARNLDAQSETLRLSDAVRVLTSDRDQLLTLIASLERNLGDMNGSIKAAPAQRDVDAERKTAAAEIATTTHVKFGVDLGGAASMEVLRAHWAVAKTNHARLFESLRPVAGAQLDVDAVQIGFDGAFCQI